MILRSIIAALALVCILCCPAAAQKTKSQLSSEFSTNLPDNGVGTITPSVLRSVLNDMTDSWQQYSGVNAQTGTSYTVQLSDYGQLVTFDSASSVAVSVPQATGSFTTFNFYALNLGSGTVTLTPTLSTINGAASLQLAQNASVWIVSDGTNYQVFQGRQQLPTGTDGQLLTGQTGGAATFESMSQDCSFSKTGTITCTKTNNVPFGPLATVAGGTSGGVQCWTGSTSPASSAALAQYGIIYGGGTGVCPGAAAAGGNGQLLLGVTGSPPQMATMSQDCTITNAGVITCTKTNGVAFGPLATQTTPCIISQGCTGQTTVPAARGASGLNIDEVTTFGDANYSAATTDRTIATTTTFSTQRTVTLPAVSSFNPGQQLVVIDSSGAINGTNDLVIAANAGDTINGTSSITVSTQYGGAVLWPIGANKWGFIAASSGGSGTVSAVAAGSGLKTGTGSATITTTGTLYQQQGLFGGRLTLTSGIPITTTDVTGATTVYYAPLTGEYVPIYNGTDQQLYQFTASDADTVGLSVALGSNWASGDAYDWFVGLNGSTVTLCSGPAWSSAAAGSSSRGTGAGTTQLALFEGVYTNAVSMTCRYNNTTGTFTCAVNQCTYVGSSLMTGAGATEDSKAKRYLFNLYNQTERELKVAEGTAAWSYTTTTWRQANANTADQLSMFVGLPGTLLKCRVDASADTSAGGSFAAVGIGINSTTADSSDSHQATNGTNRDPISAALQSYPGLGLQNYVWLEAAGIASGTNSYYGVGSGSGITYIQSAISGSMLF